MPLELALASADGFQAALQPVQQLPELVIRGLRGGPGGQHVVALVAFQRGHRALERPLHAA